MLKHNVINSTKNITEKFMDIFKSKQNKISGVGGVYCSCCNNLRGSHKRKRVMNKMVRQILKSDLQKQIKFDDIYPQSMLSLERA